MSALTPIQEFQQGAAPRRSFRVVRDGQPVSEDSIINLVKERREQAKRDRSRYEPDWYLCQSYIANKQWVGWSSRLRRVLSMLEDPREKEREHHTENVITSYFWAGASQLAEEDELPEVYFRREDVEGQKFTDEANYSLRYHWDEELDGDEAWFEALLKTVAFGTAAVRCFYRRGIGESYGEFPVGPDGQMVTDMGQAREMVARAQLLGERLRFDELRGEHQLEPLGPFNLLPPPGVEYTRNFPWMIVESARPVDDVKAAFPKRASDVRPQELAAIDMIGLRDTSGDSSSGSHSGKLKDHVVVSTCYEGPSKQFQQGRVVTWTQDTLLEEVRKLPYLVNKRPSSGIVMLHYRRVPGRFWSIGLVEPALGVQRQRNRARSQHIEMKDRNLGRVYAVKDTITQVNRPRGKIMELVEVAPGHQMPNETSGTPPGPWIADEVRMLDEAMDRVTGFGRVSALSAAPSGVSAYAGMALSKEADDERNRLIVRGVRRSKRELTKILLNGIRQYWPPGKHVLYRGEDGQFAAFVFNAAQLPEMVYCQVAKGAARPTSPAAQIQLIFDIYDRSISSGQVLPLQWLVESLDAGRPMPLPHSYNDLQRDKAEYENLLLAQGQIPPVAPYDNDEMHVQVHREAQQMRALDPEAAQTVALIEEHLQQHVMSAQQKAAAAVSAPNLQGPAGALGGMTPGGPSPATANMLTPG